jgi:hypothetical protein
MAGIKAGICLALKPGLLTKAWIALKDEGHETRTHVDVGLVCVKIIVNRE